jgi:DNA repair protein RecO (recombination protein O)
VNLQPKHSLALVLSRTNYAESDRIVTFLTKDYGKLRAIAKGVRKERSKLAAGVELFSISEIGFIVGRSELATLISARLNSSYHHFLDDLNKVEFGFESLKMLNKLIAEAADSQYFSLTEKLLTALDDKTISLDVATLWWRVNLAQLTGHSLNLQHTIDGSLFKEKQHYIFDQQHGGFVEDPRGTFSDSHIKLLKLATNYLPRTLARVKNVNQLAGDLNKTLTQFVDYHHQIRV